MRLGTRWTSPVRAHVFERSTVQTKPCRPQRWGIRPSTNLNQAVAFGASTSRQTAPVRYVRHRQANGVRGYPPLPRALPCPVCRHSPESTFRRAAAASRWPSASPIKPSLINGQKVCAMPRAARLLRPPGARLASPAALSRQGKLRVNWYVMPSPFSFRFRPRVFFSVSPFLWWEK